MNIKSVATSLLKLSVVITIGAFFTACSGGSSSSSSGGGTVTGVATPSKVSVVNTN